MKFVQLAEYFERIEETTLRNEMMKILSELFKSVEGEEIEQVVNMSLGQLRPKYDRLEFSMAGKMIVRAIAQVEKVSEEEISKRYKEKGDLGELVGEKKSQIFENKSVREVYEELAKLAKDSGSGSQERKIRRLAKLLLSLDSLSRKYVVRMVMGKLRLGFQDKTILDALSYVEYGSKEGSKELNWAYQVYPDVGKLARLAKKVGVEGLRDQVKVTIGIPVIPALAQRLKTADEMVKKMGEVVVEPKLDGSRVQIHFQRSGFEGEGEMTLFGKEAGLQVKTYTRTLDDSTAMFPELCRIAGQIKADEVILDSEAVGFDPESGEMVPFQMTITRKRKHGVGVASQAVPLKFYVFDILYKDGESLLSMSLRKRREILEKVVGEGRVLVVDEMITTSDPDEMREYHAKKLEEGYEGAMVKKVDGEYLPGRQDWNWVKFKESEDSEAKLADTLDLVVMGYYEGKGKRTKFGVGAFLAGIRKGEKIVTIGKVGTGLTDEQFGELYTKMQKCKSEKKDTRYVVEKGLVPDQWVSPEVVVEIAGDELTKSPTHSSGLALRFPRLVRFRDDKDLLGVTSIEEVREIR